LLLGAVRLERRAAPSFSGGVGGLSTRLTALAHEKDDPVLLLGGQRWERGDDPLDDLCGGHHAAAAGWVKKSSMGQPRMADRAPRRLADGVDWLCSYDLML
jgi:hypothetical protein